MKNKLITVAIFILLIGAAGFLWQSFKTPPPGLTALKINGSEIFVEQAKTPAQQNRGLAGRASLPENQGMLFLFDQPDYYAFWMKDMIMALDFVWLNGDYIVETTTNVRPQDYQPPATLVPKEKADKVLELNAGIVQKLNIKVGDKIEF